MDLGEWIGTNSTHLQSLAVYGGGIAVYTLLVTLLYVPMGHRIMLGRKVGDERVATPGRRTLYVLLFPLISFAFFLVIAGALFFLAPLGNSSLSPEMALTVSMGIVLAIRIVAYFNEDAAEELGKIMPLGLLGVVLVTNQFDSVTAAFEGLKQIFDHVDLVLVYFLIVVVVEFILRGVYALFHMRPKAPVRAAPRPGAPPPPRSPVQMRVK